MITETIYAGRDNTFSLQLKRGGVVIPLFAITDYSLHLSDGTVLDDPTFFTEKENGIVEISIGNSLETLGDYSTYLVTYDLINTHGVRWPTFKLKVR